MSLLLIVVSRHVVEADDRRSVGGDGSIGQRLGGSISLRILLALGEKASRDRR